MEERALKAEMLRPPHRLKEPAPRGRLSLDFFPTLATLLSTEASAVQRPKSCPTLSHSAQLLGLFPWDWLPPFTSSTHCCYLDIYISQNNRLREGDLKANFKPAELLVWQMRSIIFIFCRSCQIQCTLLVLVKFCLLVSEFLTNSFKFKILHLHDWCKKPFNFWRETLFLTNNV